MVVSHKDPLSEKYLPPWAPVAGAGGVSGGGDGGWMARLGDELGRVEESLSTLRSITIMGI